MRISKKTLKHQYKTQVLRIADTFVKNVLESAEDTLTYQHSVTYTDIPEWLAREILEEIKQRFEEDVVIELSIKDNKYGSGRYTQTVKDYVFTADWS
jgi:hypothetical protein